ncbi:MAG: autotransporter-associated beta strand repeat-containing protein, partial [Pseudomonadota bacterium]
MKPSSLQISFAPALVFIVGLLTSTAIAQTTSYWDGGSVGSNVTWTTASNWVGDVVAPSASNSDLVFNNRTGGGLLPSALNIGADRIAGLITFDNINSVLPATLNIDTNASSTTSPRTLTLFTGITLQNTATTVYLRGNNSTLSIVLGANNTFTTSTGATLQIAPIISGAFRVTKAGEGTVSLEASNTFTGGVMINQGTLRILTTTGVGATPSSFVADQVIINGGTLEYAGSGNTSTANRGFSLGSSVGTISVSTPAATYQIAGVISDVAGQAGVLRKTGTGTLYLNPGSGWPTGVSRLDIN